MNEEEAVGEVRTEKEIDPMSEWLCFWRRWLFHDQYLTFTYLNFCTFNQVTSLATSRPSRSSSTSRKRKSTDKSIISEGENVMDDAAESA